MFDDSRTRKSKWSIIGVCTLAGALLGFILGKFLTGAFIGYMGGIVFAEVKYGTTKPRTPEEKKVMRLMVWALSATVIIGALTYSRFSGDLVSGLGAGIGLVFSVGLSFGSMYDERISAIFSKASRNAFVVLVMAMSIFGFLDEAVVLTYPEVIHLVGNNLMLNMLWVSYFVFAGSWVYHAYVRGE